MKKKILVFPCGSEIGLEIYRSLSYEKNLILYGGSSMKCDPGKMYYENYDNNFPYITDDKFYDYLNDFINKNNIDIFYPAMDLVIKNVAENLDKINCKVIIGDPHTINICMSKKKTYEILKTEVKVPKILQLEEIKDFPVFVKPDFGYGSRGAFKVNNYNELKGIDINKYLILEYLPGDEYTVECFTNNHGELIFVKGRKRSRIINGISASTYFVDNKEFEKIALKINKKLNFNGAWFFQLKEDINKKLTLLEVAPRIAGVSGLVRNLGVNLPLLNLYNLENSSIKVIENKFNIELEKSLVSKYKVDINYKHVYIDLDDTIILNNKINSTVIKFIYECINSDCKVYLITKHQGDLQACLRKYKISNLFDEIIWISKNEKKSDYIKHHDQSIFIDDSFSEREEVYKKLKIPVFSPDAIECLLK